MRYSNNTTVQTTSDTLKCRDLGLSSALYIHPQVKLLDLERDPRGFYWFVFSNKDICEQIANKYWFDSLLVENAKALNDARKQLMDKMHGYV